MVSKKYYPTTERQRSAEMLASKYNYCDNMYHYEVLPFADPIAIQEALNSLIARHEGLRTTFEFIDGILYQVVHHESNLGISPEYRDLKEFQSDKKVLFAFVEEIYSRGKFNMATGPLFKVMVVRCTPDHYLLILVIDHIIADLKSIEILKKEFSLFYEGSLKKKAVFFDPLLYQMKDHAIWEGKFNLSDEGQENLSFWNNEIRKDLVLMQKTNNVDFPENNFHSQVNKGGYKMDFFLDADYLREIRKRYFDDNIALLSIVAYWHSLISKSNIIIIAAPVSSRDTEQLEGVVGYLMIAQYVKLKIDSDNSFLNVFERVLESYSDVLKHRNYSRSGIQIQIDDYCGLYFNNMTFLKNSSDVEQPVNKGSYVNEVPYYPINIFLNSYNNGYLLSMHLNNALFEGRDYEFIYDRFIYAMKTAIAVLR